MDIIKTLDEAKALSQNTGDPELRQKISELEVQVRSLLREKQESLDRCTQLEAEHAARLRTIRHDAAQPLTTVQFFLDLLPSVLQQEQLVPAKFVNQNYWTNTYGRAQAALKTIPQILQS